MTQNEKNEKLANDIKSFLLKNKLAVDTRIYFNGMAYDSVNSTNEYEALNDITPTDYFEYANNETVSMSYEGELYDLINHRTNSKLYQKFEQIFEKHNCWFEFGYAWSLSVYYNE
jgi:hypothetical protein